jgi:LuxR family maltose regulon positive regulatory protein
MRVVRRPRLVESLAVAVSTRRLTLVAGPAGGGKTTLLTSWIADGVAPKTTAWLTLDAHDDTPQRFWSAVLQSLAHAGALVDGRVVDAVATPSLTPSIDLVPLVAAELSEGEDVVALVLDDFHLISDKRVLEGVGELLAIAPSRLRVVIASRRDPRLPLPRLRVAGELAELRAAALSFTQDEARQLMAGHGLALSRGDLDALVARTEGWAAALAMAAVALRAADEPSATIQRFAGDDRAVSDYLASEVLATRDPASLDFLLRTAVVDEITGSLADALTGGEGGGDVLAELERGDCFVVALDGHGRWYRYHRLFLDLLRSRLARLPKAERDELHARAAHWLAANGAVVEAMQQAIAAQDWRFAADLVADHWLDAFLVGRSAALRPLLESLPREFAEREPGIAVACAAIHLELGEGDRADAYLELAAAALGKRPPHDPVAELLAVVTLQRARSRGDLDAAVDLAEDLLGGTRGTFLSRTPERRALVLLMRGAAEVWTGASASASRHLRESLMLARRSGQEYVELAGLGYLGLLQAMEGRLEAASELAAEALALASRHGWSGLPHAAPALATLGTAQLHACDPAARTTLDEAAAICRASGDLPLQLSIAAARALASLDEREGGPRRGLELLAAAQDEASTWRPPAALAERLLCVEVRLLLAAREDAEALARLDDVSPGPAAAALAARQSLSRGEPAVALTLLEPHLECGPGSADVPTRIELHLLAAVAHSCRLNHEVAATAFEQALGLADPDRFTWIFLQAGSSLRDLLVRQIRRGTAHRGLVEDLLTRLDRASGQPDRAGPLLEPLSERERTILSYLETMLSTDEIAGELFLSTNTIKSHAKSIYRKLGVTRRRDAVLRARALRLL